MSDGTWLERYRDVLPIRARGAFQLVSARRADTGRGCVVVLPGPKGDARRVASALAEVERVHGLIDHPLVPRVSGRGEAAGKPWLELDCAAIMDGFELVRMLADAETKMPYVGADAFISSLRMAMVKAHEAIDPRTGKPVVLGRLSAGNVLFDADGRWSLIGYGRNFPIEKDDGTVDGTVAYFQAPEVATGGEPTPTSDYVMLIYFMRSVLGYVEPSPAIARLMRGQITEADRELVECLQWVERRMLGELPSQRATIPEAIAVAERIRVLTGIVMDEGAFADYVAALLRANEVPAEVAGQEPEAALGLTLPDDGAWLAGPDGRHYRLGRALRRIMQALVEQHAADPLTPLRTLDLLEAGWPGERPEYEVGNARVYVAINRLRGMGLRDVIERFDDGYRLHPRAYVRRVAT